MDINALQKLFIETIAVDADVIAWCQENYGKKHSVHSSFDSRNLPGQDDCPMVVVYPLRKYTGEGVTTRHHEIQVVVHVYNTGTRSHPSIDNIVDYDGNDNVEIFRKLVETVIAGIDIGNALIMELSADYDIIQYFPLFSIGMVTDIVEEYTLGTDAFA